MMAVTVAGKQICKSTHTRNKRLAIKIMEQWDTLVFERRYQLPKSVPAPYFDEWAEKCIKKMRNSNTRKRYMSSIRNLKSRLFRVRLSEISPESLEAYEEARLAEGVQAATINHDLRVLHKVLRKAIRKKLITCDPFAQVDFLEEQESHAPHILTYQEEEKILTVAVPYLRMLVVLILETGMRSHREALCLRWDAVDFVNDMIRVRQSKTRAGIRAVPLSVRCKTDLLRWQNTTGPEFSPFVFPNFRKPGQPIKDIRHSWAKALKDAGIPYFWIYNLRHTFASRLSAAGVPDLFVAQMIGHSSPGILQVYSKAIDDFRRDAVRKLEQMRSLHGPETVLKASTPTVN